MATATLENELTPIQPNADSDDPTLLSALERVSIYLNEALRLFAEGDEAKACCCLAEANVVIEECQAEFQSEAVVIPIAAVTDSSSAGQEEIPFLQEAIA